MFNSSIARRPVFLTVAVFALALIAACDERGRIVTLPQTAGATSLDILVASNRAPDENLYGADRQNALSFARIAVSVPPTHQPGNVEYPGGRPDPARSFGITSALRTDSAATFGRMLAAEAALRPAGQRDVVVFVHGYNNTFAESLYRFGQIVTDFDLPDVPVLYAWPSGGLARDYLYDRDSIMFSRSGLELLLDQLNAAPVDRITVVAHSMGSQLVIETLRQHAIRTGGRQWGKLGAVVLIAPDIDIEVFGRQVADIGRLPQPFVVIGSAEDRALQLSRWANASQGRLGFPENADALAALGVVYIDSTFAAEPGSDNHMSAVTSPVMIAMLRRLIDQGRGG
jgi:esterase/lipase superfamily enzyme